MERINRPYIDSEAGHKASSFSGLVFPFAKRVVRRKPVPFYAKFASILVPR